MKQQH
ncbi:hypothetical protein D037_4929A, partial [Vibrio parahaemolyticus IDH02640]